MHGIFAIARLDRLVLTSIEMHIRLSEALVPKVNVRTNCHYYFLAS